MSTHLGRGTYFGRVARRRHCAGLSMMDVCHASGIRLPQHSHETAFLCVLLDGSYTETFGPTTLAYRPFTLGFHPPGLSHRDEIGMTGGRLFTLEVDTAWLERLRDGYPRATIAPGEVRDGWAVGLMMRLYGAYWRARDPLTSDDALHVESLGLELLAATTRLRTVPEPRRPRWLSSIVESLHASPAAAVRVTALAQSAGVHPVHLARVFRQRYGCTMAQYQAGVRVQLACARVASRDASLAQIAADLGFADQSHFTRVFVSIVGYPPVAFRQMVRQGRVGSDATGDGVTLPRRSRRLHGGQVAR